jgi:hypothetical protein
LYIKEDVLLERIRKKVAIEGEKKKNPRFIVALRELRSTEA